MAAAKKDDPKNDAPKGAASPTETDAGEGGTARLQHDYDALRGDLDALRGDLTRLRDSGGDLAADAVAEARARLEAETERLSERLNELAGGAENEGRRLLDEAEREVREHPLRTLAVSFGVGLLLGWLTRRR